MKTKILLLVSFGLNMVLMAGFWMNRSGPRQVAKSELAADAAAARDSKVARSGRTVQTITVNRDKALDWRSVETDDYRAYIENLRAIGCPEETVRDIIIADINKLYASKIAALYPSPKEIKFWRVEDRLARNEERERDQKRHELDKEKRDLIEELLGVDYESELARLSGRPSDDASRYGFLSPEKQEQAKALHDKYREMERALFGEGGGWTTENRAKFTALRAERESEMAKLLGPEEFEQYQLRSSYTARNMRENLTSFQPDENEFRKIFQLKKTFDDQFGFSRDGSDDAVREERKLAQQKLDEQLRATLGEERFHDYQLSQDERFRDIYDFTQRYNLPRQTADTVYQVRLAAEQERDRIRNDANLSADARAASLLALSQDTQAALQPTLGQNWGNYQERNEWFRRLAQNGDSSRNRGGRDRGRR
ncbi:MAG: hypothetical protein ABIR24_01075 [Verrucomicrobiota bacterium]